MMCGDTRHVAGASRSFHSRMLWFLLEHLCSYSADLQDHGKAYTFPSHHLLHPVVGAFLPFCLFRWNDVAQDSLDSSS